MSGLGTVRAAGAPEVVVAADAAALADEAAARIARAAREAVAARGRCDLVLAGGGTPRAAYERLAALGTELVPWAATHCWFGDERCVPPDDAASNHAMAHAALLARVPVPPAQVHRMEGERPPAEASTRYEAALRTHAAAHGDGVALFDVLLLGMGEDGHTASLFPGSPALEERERWVTTSAAPPGAPVRDRLTLTFPAIHRAHEVLLLVAGAAKADAVARALAAEHPLGAAAPPVAGARGLRRTIWLLDRAAASALPPGHAAARGG